MCAFTIEYLSLTYYNYTTELYSAVRRASVYLYTRSMYFCSSSFASFSVAIMPLLLQLLLHAAAVRHRVPDDKFC